MSFSVCPVGGIVTLPPSALEGGGWGGEIGRLPGPSAQLKPGAHFPNWVFGDLLLSPYLFSHYLYSSFVNTHF